MRREIPNPGSYVGRGDGQGTKNGTGQKAETADAFKRPATDLDRIEMLGVVLDAFARAIADYEPRFNPNFGKVLLQRSKG